nr:MAG TPA: hypothetical protein [Caudoviricetes sp.]
MKLLNILLKALMVYIGFMLCGFVFLFLIVIMFAG